MEPAYSEPLSVFPFISFIVDKPSKFLSLRVQVCTGVGVGLIVQTWKGWAIIGTKCQHEYEEPVCIQHL